MSLVMNQGHSTKSGTAADDQLPAAQSCQPLHPPRGRGLSPRHEAFAQAVAGGAVSAGEAYRKLYPQSKSWETDGPRLLRSAQVKKRVAELQAEQAASAQLDRDALRRWCERVILAKPNQATLDSDLCETVMTRNGPVAVLCSKLGAMDRLIRLCGLDKGTEPEKKVSDTLGMLVARIRARTPA